jgi:hypothetical protein
VEEESIVVMTERELENGGGQRKGRNMFRRCWSEEKESIFWSKNDTPPSPSRNDTLFAHIFHYFLIIFPLLISIFP